MRLFSEDELLDVLTGVDISVNKGAEASVGANSTPGPSVNVVLDGDVFSSEKAFAEFMESLTSDEDVNTTAVSDDYVSESTNTSEERALCPAMEEKKRCLEFTAEKNPVGNTKPKRKRRKHELDHLRAVAVELEKKLKALNHSSGRDKPGSGQVWKHISDQMLSERQKAVGENARLREMVKEQVKSVKSLQRTLTKTPDLSKMGISPMCSNVGLSTRCQTSTKDLYQDLFKNISSSYSDDVSDLLQDKIMPPPSTVCNRKMNMEMEMIGDSGPRMSLQFVESRFVPFSFVRIGDHAWSFLSGSNGHEDFQMALQHQGNEMYGHCTVTSPDGLAQLLGNIAVRRYCEPNKLTFVWECDGECPPDGASGMRIHQKGWCVFEPSEEDPENATVFRTCARMTPSLSDSASIAASVGNMTDVIIQNYEKSVVYIFDAVLESLANQGK